MLCDNKANFIQALLSLDPNSQSFLQGMVQRAMSRAVEVDSSMMGKAAESSDVAGGTDTGLTHDNDSEAALIQSREMTKHLQEEQSRLLNNLATSEATNTKLSERVQVSEISYFNFASSYCSPENLIAMSISGS